MSTARTPDQFQALPDELGDIFWHPLNSKGYWSIIRPLGLTEFNYVKNPSFEFSTTYWQESVTATMIRGAGGTHGGYRLKVSSIGPGVFDVQYLGGLTCAANTYLYGSLDIFARPDTSVTISFAKHPTLSTPTDCTFDYRPATFVGQSRWQRIFFRVQANNDGTTPAQLAILVEATPILNNLTTDIFIDAVKVGNYDTYSYFDGDTTGALWDGVPHDSTSHVDQFQRQYGFEYNFNENGWSFISDEGAGMPTVENNSTGYAQGQGSHLNLTRSPDRTITLTFQSDFDTDSELDEKIVELIDAMSYAYEGQCTQEFLLKYQKYDDCGNEVTNALLIPVSYNDGLQLIRKTPGSARVAIQFTAKEQPFFETLFELTNTITDSATLFRNNIGRVDSPLTIEFRPTGPGATLTSFTNVSTGHQVVFRNANGSTPLDFTSNLILYTDPRRSYFVRAFNRSSIIDLIDYDNSDLHLLRAIPGQNQFTVVASNCECIIRWKPRYRSTAYVSCQFGP